MRRHNHQMGLLVRLSPSNADKSGDAPDAMPHTRMCDNWECADLQRNAHDTATLANEQPKSSDAICSDGRSRQKAMVALAADKGKPYCQASAPSAP